MEPDPTTPDWSIIAPFILMKFVPIKTLSSIAIGAN
jgi:hypothetical protein